MHALVGIHFCVQVEVLDVNGEEMGFWRAEDTVEQNFGHGHVSGLGGYTEGVVNEITTNSDIDTVHFFLVGVDVTNTTSVSCSFAFGDVFCK